MMNDHTRQDRIGIEIIREKAEIASMVEKII